MKIEIEEKDVKTLLQCAYIADYLVNSDLEAGEEAETFHKFAQKMCRIFAAHAYTDRVRTEQDVRESLIDEVDDYLDRFEQNVYYHKLAERLAEEEVPFLCPIYEGDERVMRRFLLEKDYFLRLMAKGDGFLKISVLKK